MDMKVKKKIYILRNNVCELGPCFILVFFIFSNVAVSLWVFLMASKQPTFLVQLKLCKNVQGQSESALIKQSSAKMCWGRASLNWCSKSSAKMCKDRVGLNRLSKAVQKCVGIERVCISEAKLYKNVQGQSESASRKQNRAKCVGQNESASVKQSCAKMCRDRVSLH